MTAGAVPCAAGEFAPTVPDFPPRRACAAKSPEHEARGLLNAIGLLTRCLEAVPATEDERLGWEREIRSSRERLECLYTAGLDRNFRSAAPDTKSHL